MSQAVPAPPALRLRCRSYVVIPARLHSTRLPEKLLLKQTGKALIQYTYEAAAAAHLPMGICVATDHERIAREVRGFGGEVQLTNPQAASGTDRVAEIARGLPDVDIFVNVQGDEPELPGSSIDTVIRLLQDHSEAQMATLATPIRDRQLWLNPACVKVTMDRRRRALYFSRSPIPWHHPDPTNGQAGGDAPLAYQHIGIYAYRRDFLLALTQQPRSGLEMAENLEQLRALEGGATIMVGVVAHATKGIDTPADYEAFVKRMAPP